MQSRDFTPRGDSVLRPLSSLSSLVPDQHGVRTLVVDDSAGLREAICDVLELEQLATVVAQASNGAEGIELASALRPELVLMDVSMPVMGGLDAAAVIRQLLPESRIFLMSGEETEEMEQRALASGADAFLFKSGFPEDFLALVGAFFPKRFISS